MRKRSNARAKHNADFKQSGYIIEVEANHIDKICDMLTKKVVRFAKIGNKIMFKHKQTMDRANFYIENFKHQ